MSASYVVGESVELTVLYHVELIGLDPGLDPWTLDSRPWTQKKTLLFWNHLPTKNLPLPRHLSKFVEKKRKLIMILCSKTHQGT